MELDELTERVIRNEVNIEWLVNWVGQLKNNDLTITLLIISGLGAIAMLVLKNKDKD